MMQQTQMRSVLGKQEEPLFWQVALIAENEITNIEQTLFSVTIKIEENEAIHVASLSRDHVVYKVLGAGDTLVAYYNDLQHPLIASTMTLGHNRYSTNTLSNFFVYNHLVFSDIMVKLTQSQNYAIKLK